MLGYTNINYIQEEKQRGVITASAGNHALALAYYGKELNIPVTVVLPISAPEVKVSILCSDIHIVMRFVFSKMTARVDNL